MVKLIPSLNLIGIQSGRDFQSLTFSFPSSQRITKKNGVYLPSITAIIPHFYTATRSPFRRRIKDVKGGLPLRMVNLSVFLLVKRPCNGGVKNSIKNPQQRTKKKHKRLQPFCQQDIFNEFHHKCVEYHYITYLKI